MPSEFTVYPIAITDLTASDLRDEAETYHATAQVEGVYRVRLFDAAGFERTDLCLEVLRLTPDVGRTGIASNADASWADSLADVEADVACYLDDADEWEARN